MAPTSGSQEFKRLDEVIGLTFGLAGYEKAANELQTLGEYCGQLRDEVTSRELKARGFFKRIAFTENGGDPVKVDFMDTDGKAVSEKFPEQIDAWLASHGEYQDDPRWKRFEVVRAECDRYADLLGRLFEILCQCPSMEDVAVAFRFVPNSAQPVLLHELPTDWAAFAVDLESLRNAAGKLQKRAAIAARHASVRIESEVHPVPNGATPPDIHTHQKRGPEEPTRRDWQAHQLVTIGAMTQVAAARCMVDRGIPMRQSQVSRAHKKCKEWIKAGKTMPDVMRVPLGNAHARAVPIDPKRIEIGERTDRRTRSQRKSIDTSDD